MNTENPGPHPPLELPTETITRHNHLYYVLRGTVFNGLLHVYCPWCGRKHIHSYDKRDKATPTHRTAHCHNRDNPAVARGYFVAPFYPQPVPRRKRAKAPK